MQKAEIYTRSAEQDTMKQVLELLVLLNLTMGFLSTIASFQLLASNIWLVVYVILNSITVAVLAAYVIQKTEKPKHGKNEQP